VRFVRDFDWNLSTKEAASVQRALAAEVRLEDRVARLDLVAGVDLAIGRFADTGRIAVVLWRPADGAVVESIALELPLTMPYVPGLLAFREGPLIQAALEQVRGEPDVLLFDGQGIAHPRRCGIASQVGILLDRPTVGVAKSRLWGAAPEPGPEPGDREPLLAPDGAAIGAVLRTRRGSKPLYVSPGHLVSVERAAEIVMACVRGHRLPEPTHLADRLSKLKGEG
jgi:deoxyribonuclease V